MRYDRKTKAQLLEELAELRRKVATLEETRAHWERTAEPLRVAKELERIFNLSLDLICVAGLDGYYKWVNPAFERILGWTEEESLSRPFMEFIHPDDRPAAEEHMRKLAAGAEVVCFEDRDLCKDGSVRWLSWAVVPIKEEGVVYGVGRDITEQKRAEEALRISEQNYREIFNGVNDIIVIHDPESGAVLEVNARAREAFGYSPEEKERPTLSDFCSGPPYTLEKALEMVRKAAAEGPQVFEWLNRRRDGTTFWVEVNLKPAVIGGQRRLLAVARDVTRRKQAEEALSKARDELEERVEERTAALRREIAERRQTEEARRRSESRYRQLCQSLRDAYGVVNMEGRITECNTAFTDMLGYSAEEIRRLTYEDITPEQWHEHEARIIRDQVFTRGYSDVYEKEYRRKDGTVFPIELRTFLMRDESGNPTAMWAIIRDTTQRKRAEAALRHREALLSSMIENMPVDFWARDLECRLLLQSPQTVEWWGDLRGKPFETEEVPPETLEQWRANNERALRGEVVRGEVQLVTRRGERKDFYNVVAPVVIEGEIHGILGINLDITDRKRAEQALRESEEKYRALAEKVNDIPYSVDLDGRFTYIGPQVARYGSDPQDILGQSYLEFVDSDDRQRVADDFQRSLTTGGEFPTVFRVRTAEGRTFWLEDEGRMQRDESGRVVGMTGILRDVTERKRMQQALEENEALLRQVLDLNPALIFVTDRHGTFLLANRGAAEAYGTTPEAMVGMHHLDFRDDSGDVPEAVERCLRRDREVIESKQPLFLPEEAVAARDGTTHYYQTTKIPLAVKGDPDCVLAVSIDITERKRAEQAILEEQQRLHRLLSMYERDRRLVAYEIHDGFTQPLAGALMQLEGGLQLAKSRYPDLPLESCESALELLRKSIDQARRLMGGLRPAVLEEFGVVAAIENLVEDERRRTEATIEVAAEVDFDRLEDPLELAIFRIVQEALANAVSHSGSERIRVALVQQGDRLRIEVRDEGAGFDPARVEPGCFGLEGIRVRARLFGGNAAIQSSPSQGAHLVVELPLVERAADAPHESAP